MYKINITLSTEREIKMTSSAGGVTGESNSAQLVFEIPKIYSSYTKYLDIFKESGEVTQTVVSISDEERFSYLLPGKLTDNLNLYMQLVLKKGSKVFKSYRFALTFEEGINATSYLESEFQDSIQKLYEQKADKSETAKLEKSLENKISVKMFYEEKQMLLNEIYSKPDFIDIPKKTSELENDSYYVSDKNYVHTDRNFTADLSDKLLRTEDNAQKNIQSDWKETDEKSDAFIKNKPTKLSDFTDDMSTESSKNKVDAISAADNLDSEHYPSVVCLAGEVSRLEDRIPQKISDLTDDTGKTDAVKWAESALFSEHAAWSDNAGFAEHAIYDGSSNDISETYATKTEMKKTGELIEEIVITDENNAKEIKRNLEPDGTPYDFKAVWVYYVIKPCTVQNLIIINTFEDIEYSGLLSGYQGNCAETTSGRFVDAHFDVFGGQWFAIGNATTIQGSPTALQAWRGDRLSLYEGQRIKSLSIRSNTASEFEVGSVIRIYGVR